jgi:hypothetical protein
MIPAPVEVVKNTRNAAGLFESKEPGDRINGQN